MFLALLGQPQEALHKLQLVYNVPSAACVATPEDEQVILETCRGILLLLQNHFMINVNEFYVFHC
jgi:hypothetical protein